CRQETAVPRQSPKIGPGRQLQRCARAIGQKQVGGLCQKALCRPQSGFGLSITLHAPSGYQSRAPSGVRWGEADGDLCVEGLRGWWTTQDDGAGKQRVFAPVLPASVAGAIRQDPSLWLARKSSPPRASSSGSGAAASGSTATGITQAR